MPKLPISKITYYMPNYDVKCTTLLEMLRLHVADVLTLLSLATPFYPGFSVVRRK